MHRAADATDPVTIDPGDREFTAVRDGCYRLTLPLFGIVFEADRLRWDHHELHGELAVSSEIPGAQPLPRANFNFSSLRARQDLAKLLASRSNARDFDWFGFLDDFGSRLLVAERTGRPSVLLRDVPCPDPHAQHLDLHGLALPRRHAGILHGPGGTLKSFLALWLAGELQQRGERVGFLDWELDESDHRLRFGRLFGDAMPAVTYIRCERPFVVEVDRIRRLADDDELTYLMFDSVAFACDGPPEAAEVAGRYFRALRQLGERGSLHLAHTNKAEGNDSTMPFGSVFWFNGARATWALSASETSTPEAITVALTQRKANLGPLRPAVGLQATFTHDRTTFERVDVTTVHDLAAKLPIRQRMTALLRRGPMSPDIMANELEADAETIKRTVRRYKTQFTVLPGGALALLERRA